MKYRKGDRVECVCELSKYKGKFGDIIGCSFEMLRACFLYSVKFENGDIVRFPEKDIYKFMWNKISCECGGLHMEIENHMEHCPMYRQWRLRMGD